MISTTLTVRRLGVRGGAAAWGERAVAEETPVAIVHGGSTHAVMMATPADLEDFAVGFSLTEGVIESLEDIVELEVVTHAEGIELRLWLTPGRASEGTQRRRALIGPTGCGLCGVESLELAGRSLRRPLLTPPVIRAADLCAAMEAMEARQTLSRATRAAHAAGFWRPAQGLVAVREDVGRHNALDKLIGALARTGTAADGVILLTSRVSVEMVQKAASVGAPVIAAVSAPTGLAIRTAQACGVTLAAVVRADGLEVFCGEERLIL